MWDELLKNTTRGPKSSSEFRSEVLHHLASAPWQGPSVTATVTVTVTVTLRERTNNSAPYSASTTLILLLSRFTHDFHPTDDIGSDGPIATHGPARIRRIARKGFSFEKKALFVNVLRYNDPLIYLQ